MDPGLRTLLPEGLRVETVIVEVDSITVVAAPVGSDARCPICGQPSSRVHRRRERALSDLPWAGLSASLRIRVRHFRCLAPLCPRRVFAERLAGAARPFARRTDRLGEKLAEIGLALGGEPGARLAAAWGIDTSPDTLLRLIRATPCPEVGKVDVLGVDDWSLKKGRVYGTILVDLERHRPIDLLPGRSSEAFASWLRSHPGVETITRDRAEAYADGASQGAPKAAQVADRWHLLKNLREAAERFCIRHHSQLPASSPKEAAVVAVPTEVLAESETAPRPRQTSKDRQSLVRCERRKARYDEVKLLHARGMGARAIGRTIGLDHKTVGKYVRLSEFPEMSRRRPRVGALDAYKAYLDRRWTQGCRNGATLLAEIRRMGYSGGRSIVAEYVTRLRRGAVVERVGMGDPVDAGGDRKPGPRLSARQASWLLVRPIEELSERQKQDLDALLESCPAAGTVWSLARAFDEMVRRCRPEGQREALWGWLQDAEDSGVQELREYAAGIRRDVAAVGAALTVKYSSGQTEGQVNRLKLIKRQMYGRAGLDLLRRRVLHRERRVGSSRCQPRSSATRGPPTSSLHPLRW